jgi:hypothetical protein
LRKGFSKGRNRIIIQIYKNDFVAIRKWEQWWLMGAVVAHLGAIVAHLGAVVAHW